MVLAFAVAIPLSWQRFMGPARVCKVFLPQILIEMLDSGSELKEFGR